jgi:hypothetical protein
MKRKSSISECLVENSINKQKRLKQKKRTRYISPSFTYVTAKRGKSTTKKKGLPVSFLGPSIGFSRNSCSNNSDGHRHMPHSIWSKRASGLFSRRNSIDTSAASHNSLPVPGASRQLRALHQTTSLFCSCKFLSISFGLHMQQ